MEFFLGFLSHHGDFSTGGPGVLSCGISTFISWHCFLYGSFHMVESFSVFFALWSPFGFEFFQTIDTFHYESLPVRVLSYSGHLSCTSPVISWNPLLCEGFHIIESFPIYWKYFHNLKGDPVQIRQYSGNLSCTVVVLVNNFVLFPYDRKFWQKFRRNKSYPKEI